MDNFSKDFEGEFVKLLKRRSVSGSIALSWLALLLLLLLLLLLMSLNYSYLIVFSLFFCRFGTRRVLANAVYKEYISDKSHLHMNSTDWGTLTEFCKYLGKNGVCEVDETPKGWFIKYIDRDPDVLRRQVSSSSFRFSLSLLLTWMGKPFFFFSIGSSQKARNG